MKRTLIVMMIAGMLVLSACGSPAQAVTNTLQPAATFASQLPSGYENALPVNMQLVVGTLKLDGSGEAVTVDQAAQLLPLWKAAQSLAQNSNTAQQEIDAVYQQIEETMTPAQIQAIAAMKLTQADLASIGGRLGFNPSFNPQRTLSADQQSTAVAARATRQAERQVLGQGGQGGQGFPGGAPPDGGFPGGGAQGEFFFRGGGNGGNTGGTPSANRRTFTAGGGIDEAVIRYLMGLLGTPTPTVPAFFERGGTPVPPPVEGTPTP